ncbi:MAG: class I SAM-dependent methyltransferase [Proteobacteria bacterium]|nr:class I SAM-dependent methyltransferase [Pseudomonadota bacterium]
MQLPIDIESVKGFLHADEGAALYQYAAASAPIGPCLELGSYCGKSTVYLGTAARDAGSLVFAVDHHRGSEEHQRGEEYHDPELFDVAIERMDSLPALRRTLARADLEAWVVPVVAASVQLGAHWTTPLGMVFIDGGHSLEAAQTDYRNWSGHVQPGGILAIHDIFSNPEDGGQAPHTIFQLALASGLFVEVEMRRTLAILRRL